MTPRLLAAALALSAVGVFAGDKHLALVSSTPCLSEYRVWSIAFRRPEPFPVPAEFTQAQCDLAARLNHQIDAELEAEQATRLARIERAERAAAAAAHTASRQRSAEVARQAALPMASVGMTAADVTTATRLGAPISISRTTTAAGRREIWHYGSGVTVELDTRGRVSAVHERVNR